MAHRKIMVALCVVVSLCTIPLFMVVGKSFLPVDDRSEFQVTVKAPEGTSLAATLTIAERMARDLRAQPGVTATLTTIGSSQGGFASWPRLANRATIY